MFQFCNLNDCDILITRESINLSCRISSTLRYLFVGERSIDFLEFEIHSIVYRSTPSGFKVPLEERR